MSLQRIPLLFAVAIASLLAALPAAAHEGHSALPDGFRAEVVAITDGEGRAAVLDDVLFSVSPDGMEVTVSNAGDAVIEVTGEQGGEPLLRLTASEGAVNEASPQATDVAGAVVDEAAAAELIDLAWGRVEPRWVPLPRGGSASFVDHRATLGHAPDRAAFTPGEVAGEWRIRFLYDGLPYEVNGQVAVVDAGDDGLAMLWIPAVLLVAFGAGGAVSMARRRPT